MLWWLPSFAHATVCGGWAPTEIEAEVADATAESSGLAPAHERPGVWYTHGDHGTATELLAFTLDGDLLERHAYKNFDPFDAEDVADAPCPDEGRCLWVADIGDNDLERDGIGLSILREPVEDADPVSPMAAWTGVWPDGPVDAEALLVHPCSGDVYVVTKEYAQARVYRWPAPSDEAPTTLVLVATLDLEGDGVTGADWDADGERVVLRTATQVYGWVTDPDDPEAHWIDAPTALSSTELLDGEAVAFDPDSGDIVLTSEGDPMPVARIRCVNPTPAVGQCTFPQTGPAGCCGDGRADGGGLLALLLSAIGVRAGRSSLRDRRLASR